MKYLRSILCIIISVFILLSLCACGKKADESKNNSDNKNATAQTQEATQGETQGETQNVEPSSSETPSASENNTDVDNPPSGTINTQIPGAVGESSPVDSSYFDDAAFIGDSVSLKLSYYAAATGDLGNAQFFASGSLGSANSLWEISDESVHPTYQGQKMLVEDCIFASGAKKVYVMLGMNDLGLYGLEDTLVNFETLMDRILEKCPDVKICVQSMTPMTETSYILGDSLNNPSINEYNRRLSEISTRRGWAFIDVASVMYDASGSELNRDYCSDPDDMGVHFTEAGCAQWIEYLKTHAVS